MPASKIIIVVIASALCVMVLMLDNMSSQQNDVGPDPQSGRANQSVFVTGCRSFNEIPPEKKLPAVKQNFVTRLCALEVFPPYDVMALQQDYVHKARR